MARTKIAKRDPKSLVPDSLPSLSLKEEIAKGRKYLKRVIKEYYIDEFEVDTIDDFMSRAFEQEGHTAKATPANILKEIEKFADCPKEIRERIAQNCGNVLICYDEDESGNDKNESTALRFVGTLTVHLNNLDKLIKQDLRAMTFKHFLS